MTFSLVVTPAVLLAALSLAHPAPDDGAGLMYAAFGSASALASMLSVFVLVAALVERRPVWSDRRARWAWVWAVISFGLLGGLGIAATAGPQTVGSTLLYAAGMFAILFGGAGLVIATVPHSRVLIARLRALGRFRGR